MEQRGARIAAVVDQRHRSQPGDGGEAGVTSAYLHAARFGASGQVIKRVQPPANPLFGLDHNDPEARRGQQVGSVQPGKASTNDDDVRLGLRPRAARGCASNDRRRAANDGSAAG
jgi:hypothetical protein